MAAINHDVTEEQLKDAYNAVIAVQKEKGHNPLEAKNTAELLSYAVFRGIITYESLMRSIVKNAENVFSH